MKEWWRDETEDFRKRSILAVCCAGSDRSRYIADELNRRGYMASSAGVLHGHNYVTPEDLESIGVIVFSSVNEKKIFDRDKRLVNLIKSNRIEVRIMHITESDKDRAHSEGTVIELKENIARQLDGLGLTGY